jgi:hypothetical protein
MVVLSCSLGEREHRRMERKSGRGGMVAARRRVPRVNFILGHLIFFLVISLTELLAFFSCGCNL